MRQKIVSIIDAHLFHQKDQRFLWLPVILALGIGLYFSLPFEPPLTIITTIWLFLLSIRISIKTLPAPLRSTLLILLLFVTGVLCGALRTNLVHTPIIDKPMRSVTVEGIVHNIEPLEEGKSSRIILTHLMIERLSEDKTPVFIRLKLRQDEGIKIGQRIKALASLNPPSHAVIPGGFDFRRYLYFQRIGSVGFIYNAPEILEPSHTIFDFSSIRHRIAQRIETILPPRNAAIIEALSVGQKNALSNDDRQAIRDAGLAHMLAISGLHVGLVAGTIFFFIRLALSAFPTIALQYPIKKIAAVIAFLCAVIYMFLAGATIPTQRAVMMTGIVFLAVLTDRSPISLRLVAFSALIILIFKPESLISVSFQMSFAAVTALVYFYDVTRAFWIKSYTQSGFFQKLSLYFIGVCTTTVIASIATAPFAHYHFGQVSFIGSVSNLAAVPILAFLIMPAVLLSLLLMPFGVDFIPLYLCKLGSNAILEISYWAAGLPNAVITASSITHTAFIVFIASILFMILWKGWGKLIALPFILLAVIINTQSQKPDILIADTHKIFAFHDGENLYSTTKSAERFTLENWAKHYGLNKEEVIALPMKGENSDNLFHSCGEEGCRFTIKGKKVSYIRDHYALAQDCDWADIIISQDPIRPTKCKAPHKIDKFDTWKNGTYAIWIQDNKPQIETTANYTGNRPWSAYTQKQKD